jgi:hypothetical protein
MIEIERIAPNYTRIILGPTKLLFSYTMLVAVRLGPNEPILKLSGMSPTTMKHINQFIKDEKNPLTESFQATEELHEQVEHLFFQKPKKKTSKEAKTPVETETDL